MATYTRRYSVASVSSDPVDLLAIEWNDELGKALLKGLGEKVGRDRWPLRREKLLARVRSMRPEEVFSLLAYAVPLWRLEESLLKPLAIEPARATARSSGAAAKREEAADALARLPTSAWAVHLEATPLSPWLLEVWLHRMLLREVVADAGSEPPYTRISLRVQVIYEPDQMPTARPATAHRDLALRLLAFDDPQGPLAKALGTAPTAELPLELPFFFATTLEGRTRTEGTIHVLTERALAAGVTVGQGGDSTAW